MTISTHSAQLKIATPGFCLRAKNALYRRTLKTCQRIANKLTNSLYAVNPLLKHPLASQEYYLQLHQETLQKEYPAISNYEATTGFSIDQQWLADLALHTQTVVKSSDLCYQHGRVLYSTLRKYLEEHPSQALTIVETGTARGFSALCMAKALSDASTDATIITFDLLPHNRPIYWNCIDDHEGKKSRAQLLQPWQALVDEYLIFCNGDTREKLRDIDFKRVHFAFLDGAHNYDDIMFEFNRIKNKQQPGDVIVFDDYDQAKFFSLTKGIDEICEKHRYQKQVIQASPERTFVVATKY